MESAVIIIMVFSLSVLAWGIYCLVCSSKAIRAYEKAGQKGDRGF